VHNPTWIRQIEITSEFYRGKGMHSQKTFSLFIIFEKTEKLTKREIEQTEAKLILLLAKFSAKS